MGHIHFKHSGNAGDIIYALAGIKAVCEKLKSKAVIHLKLDTPATYYANAYHPVKDEKGEQVMLNRKVYDMLHPLLIQQDYVEDVVIWRGEKPAGMIDLDEIRHKFCNMPYGNIAKWYGYIYPDMIPNLDEPWIDVTQPDGAFNFAFDKIAVGRTSRYTNPHIDFHFIREELINGEQFIFLGLEEEYNEFCEKWDIIQDSQFSRLIVEDFLQVARCMDKARFYMGNQSLMFAIAEAIKVPRLLEVCAYAPNVQPVGCAAYDYLHQGGLEVYFKILKEATA